MTVYRSSHASNVAESAGALKREPYDSDDEEAYWAGEASSDETEAPSEPKGVRCDVGNMDHKDAAFDTTGGENEVTLCYACAGGFVHGMDIDGVVVGEVHGLFAGCTESEPVVAAGDPIGSKARSECVPRPQIESNPRGPLDAGLDVPNWRWEMAIDWPANGGVMRF